MATLRRSRTHRVVAGVAGGIGVRLGIDPLVVRVLIVVLALFGGAGLLFYALAWLLIPDESTDLSVVEQAFGPRRDGRSSSLLLAVGLALLAVATAGAVLTDNFGGVLLLAVLLLGGAFLLHRRDERPPLPAPATPASSGYVGDTWAQPPAGDPSGWTGTTSPGAPGTGAASPLAEPYPGLAGGPPWHGASQPAWAAPTPPPAPPRQRSVLFPLTLSAVAVVLGVLGAMDAAGVAIPAATYWAWALGVVGAGLLLGTWFGRSRGLIVVGVLLIPVLAITAAAHRIGELGWDRTGDDVTVTPRTAAEVDRIDADHSAGSYTYDLSDVDFAGRDVQMSAQVGAGELVVVVPQGVEVTVNAEAGLGSVDALGTNQGGPGVDLKVTKPGSADAGSVTLDLSVGLGAVEVSRATA